ncbi:MAG: hypothetical protein HY567_02375 [Candidatus Kerfeldbacteria bacterium]|nr:hypothetical protein [Candidatus Kerfeldbacteria bacterium]
MRLNSTLLVLTGVFVVVGLILVVVVARPRSSNNRPINQSAAPGEPATIAEAISSLTRVTPVTPPADRVTLIGGTLLTVENAAVPKRIEQEVGLPVESRTKENMTTVEGLAAATRVLTNPPKLMVVDLGRTDSGAGLSVSETTAGLAALAAKAAQAGTVLVVVSGVGVDGNDQLAAIIKIAVGSRARLVDASPLLLDANFRVNPSTLNVRGVDVLAAQLVTVLKELRGA